MTSDYLRRPRRIRLFHQEAVGRHFKPVHDALEVLQVRDMPALDSGQRVERYADLLGKVAKAQPPFTTASL